LDISQCTKLTETAGKFITDNCRNVRTLKAAHCTSVITDYVLTLIGASCKLLKLIDVSYCKSLTDAGLISLTQQKQHLIGLIMNGLDNITSKGVIELLQVSYKTLEQLEIGLADSVPLISVIG
jgi:hypothetical protein